MDALSEQIPVVDVSGFATGAPVSRARPERAIAALGQAARDYGTFYIVGHGVPGDLLGAAFECSRQFYALPLEEKKRFAAGSAGLRGYAPTPPRGDLREYFCATTELEFERDDDDDRVVPGSNRWPTRPAKFRGVMEQVLEAMTEAGRRVLRAAAADLGVETDHFDAWFRGPGGAAMRALRYPPQTPDATLRPGSSAHHELFPLALLAQRDAAHTLEFRNGDTGWHGLPPREGALVAMVGEVLTRWTNDEYTPCVHRVLNTSASDGHALVAFMFPDPHATIECVPSCASETKPPRYPNEPFSALLKRWGRRRGGSRRESS